MNTFRKIFRHSSVPAKSDRNTKIEYTSNSKNHNTNSEIKRKIENNVAVDNFNSGEMKSALGLNTNKRVSGRSVEEEIEDEDSINENENEKLAQSARQYALKDKRRSSVIVSKKAWNARRGSTLSNASSLSGSSDSMSYSDTEDIKRKPSPRDLFENKEMRKSNSRGFNEFCVRKITQSPLGKKEIEIAQKEMKGFMTLIETIESSKPLKGAKIVGCTHITSQTAVLIQSLVKLGAYVRWCACNLYSTQNEVAAAIAECNVSIFAWKGQSESDFWWSIDQCLKPEYGPYDLILDDGGDLTNRFMEKYPQHISKCRGIVEESLTGIHRLYLRNKNQALPCPAMNINESITKSEFDHYYLCKETVIDALKRSTDTVISGTIVLIVGYGSVGRGCCQALRGMGAQVWVSEIDPICAIQACMKGYKVVNVSESISQVDIVITCTGCTSILGINELSKMKDGSIVCNMGHVAQEIDIKSLQDKSVNWEKIRDDVDYLTFPAKNRIILIAQGRVANLNCSTVPSIIFSITSAAQVLGLIELFSASADRYKNDIYLLPKKCDEMVARTHLSIFGAKLNQLSDNQAHFLGINKNGPFKPNFYRY